MLIRMLSILVIATCVTARADVKINAGLSGSWHDPNVDGQGLLIDVVVDQSNLFAAWFTFSDEPPVADAADHQRWMTMFGAYSGNLAQMTLFRPTGGQLNVPQPVETTPVGTASLVFHSCTEATFDYLINDPGLSGTIELERLSPDVFCQEIADNDPGSDSEYNLPPSIESITVMDSGSTLTVNYSLADPENDVMEIQLDVVGQSGQRYRIPEAHLSGHVGYPVVRGDSKLAQWHYTQDTDFQSLGINGFQLEIIADDRYVENLQEIIDLVSTERLVADIEFMQGVRHHAVDPVHLEATRQYLRDEMANRQLVPVNQRFTWQGSEGVNVYSTLQGANDDGNYYAVDGHFDTVTTTPGADDNASGTAGMLEAMRVLSQFNSETSIRFIGFDKEELGLRGARHYVANLPGDENVLGLINFEMIGYTCTNQPECVNFPNADTAIYNIRSSFATNMSDVFNSVGATHVPGLKIVSVLDDGDPNFLRSDHAPFWGIGVDALFVSDGANFRTPHYHQPTDTIDKFDVEFMTRIVKTAVGTLATVAGVTHTGSQTSEFITIE